MSINLTLHNEGAHLLPDDQNEGRDDSIPVYRQNSIRPASMRIPNV